MRIQREDSYGPGSVEIDAHHFFSCSAGKNPVTWTQLAAGGAERTSPAERAGQGHGARAAWALGSQLRTGRRIIASGTLRCT